MWQKYFKVFWEGQISLLPTFLLNDLHRAVERPWKLPTATCSQPLSCSAVLWTFLPRRGLLLGSPTATSTSPPWLPRGEVPFPKQEWALHSAEGPFGFVASFAQASFKYQGWARSEVLLRHSGFARGGASKDVLTGTLRWGRKGGQTKLSLTD